jgi:hypothetical protein
MQTDGGWLPYMRSSIDIAALLPGTTASLPPARLHLPANV